MNKCLLRHIKPLLSSLLPGIAGSLIRMFSILTRGKELQEELLQEGLDLFVETVAAGLTKAGLSPERIAEQVSRVTIIGTVLIDYWILLWDEFFSPAILLLLCLASTLDNNLVPERRDFTFEEIKQSLLDRHWPPQRQRCDFVAASAY